MQPFILFKNSLDTLFWVPFFVFAIFYSKSHLFVFANFLIFVCVVPDLSPTKISASLDTGTFEGRPGEVDHGHGGGGGWQQRKEEGRSTHRGTEDNWDGPGTYVQGQDGTHNYVKDPFPG